jgi:starch-binding outer membrane protein, SusD/RagB family
MPYMNNRRSSSWKRRLAVPSIMLAMAACTDLQETPFSSITPDQFYRNDAEVRAGLASVYNSLNTVSTGNQYTLHTIASDEQVIPVRGSDWFDNGRWLELQRHVWESNSPAGLSDVNGVWTQGFQGIARANVLLNAIEPLQIGNKAQIQGEIRMLRAYFYYTLLEYFGGVPVATDTEVKTRERNTNVEVFNFIESELNAVRNDLPPTRPFAEYGRVTRGGADALLAALYLNAPFFTGTVTAAGLQRGQTKWEEAYNAANRVIAGPYSMAPAASWRQLFMANNHTAPAVGEMVFVSARRPESGVSMNMISAALHVNQFSPAPNNGRAVQPPTYQKFAEEDQRRQIFLVGPQFHLVTGAAINDRPGARLVYTVEIPNLTAATEGHGVRMYKWPFDPARSGTNHGNDFPIFRLAEIYLIKAEAANELNRPGEAIEIISQHIRARVFNPARPLPGNLSQAEVRDAVLDERLFELFAEGKRRTDLIRHGKWTQAWWEKTNTQAHRVLMPIPQTQLDVNPLLVQNPGY